MTDIDPLTGLPKELSVWDNLNTVGKKLVITIESRKFGKKYTVVSGFERGEDTEYAKKLKGKLACGGTGRNGKVELQGNHVRRVVGLLKEFGFSEDMVEVQ
jgi:translation initiation factor 1